MGLLSNLFSEFKIKNGVLVKYTGKDANVEIPNNVTIIGEKAFTECKTLVSVTIPNSVKSIENNAFSFCTLLKEITLPNSVTSIGDWAFFYCTGLVKIVIPSSVDSIGNAICGSCSSLKQIIVYENNAKFKSIDGSLYTKSGNTLVQYAIGSNVKAFTIPSSVTSIRDWAFWGCNNLISITIPSSVTGIGLSAFHGCRNLKTIYNLSKLNIKKGAETHGAVAKFADNVYTELPKKQSTVATTKSNTTQTTNPDFDIQNGVLVKYNGKGGKVVIPSSVTTIGKRAFANFTAITSVTIPSTVKKIEVEAFDTCVGLKEVYIPASVETISGAPFIRCTNLTAIKVDANNKRFKAIEGSLYEKLDDGGIRLVQYAVGKKDTIFNLPSEVTSIQSQYVFWGDTSLKSINANDKDGFFITKEGNLYTDFGKKLLQYACGKTNAEFIVPEGVEEIGGSGCSYCKHLKKVKLPSTLKSIGHNSFQRCENLQEIVIPASVTEIKRYAFWGCKNLKTVYNLSKLDIKKGSEKYGEVAKYAENVYTVLPKTQSSVVATKPIPTPKANQTTQSSISDFDIQNGVLVKYKGKGGNVVIPNSVTTIGKDSFYNCASITNVTIPNTVKKIEDNAFDKCTGIKEITIPSSVEEIVGTPFVRCSNLTTINVSANNKKYKSIDGNLYEKLDGGGIRLVQYAVGKKDTTFNLPKEVKSIMRYTFWGNTSLKNIIANDKDGYFVTKDGNLYSNYGNRLFQYACGKTDTEFTIPEGVEEISGSGCAYCTHLKKVNLPSTLTKIGYNSFQCCDNLQEIVIPASVTEIEKNAFWGCKNLKTVYNLSKLDIQKGAYTHGEVAKCADNVYTALPKTQSAVMSATSTTKKVVEPVNPDFDIQNGVLIKYKGRRKNVEIPSNVTKIGDRAFQGRITPTSITIPNSVTSIGTWAFNGCTSLTSIIIPSSVKSIGESSFYYCTSLKNIIIPSSVTSIGDWAFYGCTSLTNITIPNSVTSVGTCAFYGCTSLDSITIPDSVTSIGKGICVKCSQLKQINVEESNVNYISIDGNLYTKDKKTLVQYAVGKEDTSFTILDSVTSIGDSAFKGCTLLKSITIPSSVTSIGSDAFVGCNHLKTIYNLSNLKVKKGADTHGYVAKCADNVYTALPKTPSAVKSATPTSQKVAEPVNPDFDIQNGVLISYKGKKEKVVIPEGVTSIGDGAFDGNLAIKNVIMPTSLISIGNRAFWGCKGMETFTIPSSVNQIGDNAFWATSLKEIFIPKTLAKIGVGPFAKCESLTAINVDTDNPNYKSIDGNLYTKNGETLVQYAIGKQEQTFVIPEHVTMMQAYAFRGHKKLREITLPKNLTKIGKNAFKECINLYIVHNHSPHIDVRSNVYANGYVGKYAKENQIFNYAQIVSKPISDFEIKDGVLVKYVGNKTTVIVPTEVTKIGDFAFVNNYEITEVLIPGGVTSIGEASFNDCTNLKKVTFPITLKEIGHNAFMGCEVLDNVILPDSVEKIGVMAFGSCYNLTNVLLPTELVEIPDYLFLECTSLIGVTIPETMERIGEGAFASCTNLTSITIPASVKEICDKAFRGCANLKTVYNDSNLKIVKGANTYGYVAKNADTIIEKVKAKPVITNAPVLEDLPVQKQITAPDFEIENGVIIAYKGNSQEIIIPDGIVEIGANVFRKNKKIISVSIPDSVKAIGPYAFNNCTSLERIDLGEGLRYIGDYAFSLCKKVEEITLPHSLTLIGEGAFQRCNAMSEVYNRSAINVIEGSNENGYVASNADIVYKENQYLKNIVIEGNVIVEYKDEREYERIALPANATAIGIEAFAGNTTIKEIHTPDSLVEIGYRAFENCSKLTKVVLGSELERIAMRAFTKCASLEAIELPDTLKSIASWSFDDCTSLKEIVIPANVTAIEDGTFYGCTSLEKVTFLGKVQSIGAYAFDGCTSLKEIVIPQTCNVDETAFYNTTCKVYNK